MSEESPEPAEPSGEAADGREPTGPLPSQHDWDMPWIEAIGAGPPERKELAAAFGEGFRKTSSLMQLLGQAEADPVGRGLAEKLHQRARLPERLAERGG